MAGPTPASPSVIDSPCIKLCRIGADNRCEGCCRTLDEISCWQSQSDAWRAAVMAELALRRRLGNCSPA